jgi:hypothetical protein
MPRFTIRMDMAGHAAILEPGPSPMTPDLPRSSQVAFTTLRRRERYDDNRAF